MAREKLIVSISGICQFTTPHYFGQKVRRIATKKPEMAKTGQNFAFSKKCHFRAKFGLFYAKNPFFSGEIKSFVTHITENPPRHLVHIGFWSDIGQNVQKMAIFGPK